MQRGAAVSEIGCAHSRLPRGSDPAAEAGSGKTAEPGDALAHGEWWAVFDDARLAELENDAARANRTLKSGFARLTQARTFARISGAERVPRVDAGAGGTRTRPSPATLGLPADARTPSQTLWRAQASASYEVDLFGRVANSIAASRDAEQTQALLRSLLLASQADVAQHYFAMRALDAEIALLDETVKLRERALSLVERRQRAGEIAELDAARARTELSITHAEGIGLAKRRAEFEHALAVLLGKAPSELSMKQAPLAFEPIAILAGAAFRAARTPARHRGGGESDGRRNARIGVARAAKFPSLTLTGALGFESAAIGELFRWSSRTWLLGPLARTLTLPET